jgi:hypothetical protein
MNNNETVKLVPLPNDKSSGAEYLMAHVEAADLSLFEPHWDKPVPDGLLAGLTVDEAMARLTEARLDEVYGDH